MIFTDFERRSEPVLPRHLFLSRLARCLIYLLIMIAISLLVGVAGYHFLEDIDWLDALLNASMILGGMGPVDTLHTAGGKLFASVYAIYSGLFLIASTGMLLAPVFHRVLHKFHAETKD